MITDHHAELYAQEFDRRHVGADFERETKDSLHDEELRRKENQRINCDRHHLEECGIGLDVVTYLLKARL